MKKSNRNQLQILLAGVVLQASLVAQTQVDLRTQSKSVDFTQATSTRPIKTGTTLPGTCVAGDLFLDLDAPSGANFFACASANTWTLQGSFVTFQSDGTTIGSRPLHNLIAGFGLINIVDDDGTRLNVQQHIDTAVVETRQGMQIGATLLCNSSSGSASAYTCAMNPLLSQYATGMVLHFKPDVTAAGGGTSLNIDTLGAKAIKLADGSIDPSLSDLVAGQLYALWYDGTNFRLMTSAPGDSASGAAQPTCATQVQGRIWFASGGAGVKDSVSVCAKDDGDTYSWRIIY